MLNDTKITITDMSIETLVKENCIKVTIKVDIYDDGAFTQRVVSKRLKKSVDLVGIMERVVCESDYLNWPDDVEAERS